MRELASASLCSAQYQTCLNDFECVSFVDCVTTCAPNDSFCVDDCANFYFFCYLLYSDYALCVLCLGCYADCDGASAGC